MIAGATDERRRREIVMTKVYVSTVIPAPAAEIWRVVRNFKALPDWTPFVAESRIEHNAPPDQIGCIRNFRLRDGGVIRERLLALSDYELSCAYAILESPMAVRNYVAKLSLTPVTDGDMTFAAWEAEFECPPEHEAALVQQIGAGVFQAAFNALKQRF
jgi:hypothetical protein